jgi:hypothetical protein
MITAIEVAASKLYRRNNITKPSRDIDVGALRLLQPLPWMAFLNLRKGGVGVVEKEAIRMKGSDRALGRVVSQILSALRSHQGCGGCLQLREEAEHQVTRRQTPLARLGVHATGS